MRSPPVVILMIHHSQWLELEIEHLFRVVEIEEFLGIFSAATVITLANPSATT